MTKKHKKILLRIILSFVSVIALNLISVSGISRFLLYIAVYILIGYDILKKAFYGIVNGRVFDENFLMAVATIGAFALSIIEKSGDYNEAVAVMIFYQIGELFQSVAVRKSRKNISELMDIRPDYANLEVDGKIKKVNPFDVKKGDIIVVNPGEKIPLDGTVIFGSTSLDTSALTGESVPRFAKTGDEILSGSVNISGLIKISVEKEFLESTVSKILELVENASSRKSKSEKFISKFARVYTPLVCCLALFLALVPPVIAFLLTNEWQWPLWIYRALTFLVISCPCALVISIPLSFFAGIGGLGREGILVKGSNYLEILSKVKCVVFDKTGTLTEGVFQVTGIIGEDKDKILEYAAYTESSSSHPVGRSIIEAYCKEIDRSRIFEIEEKAGRGITARVDENIVVVGNGSFVKELGIDYPEYSGSETVVYVALNNEYTGAILISDKIKDNSEKAVKELKKAGIKKTVMLTGDIKKTAVRIAETLGIDDVFAELLPSGKIEKLEEIIKEGALVAFVGDGINDAPALARADIGIAMGAMGSDAAIEAADLVLMDDDPLKISKAIKHSKKVLGIVKQNIIFSLFVKFVCLFLVSVGIGNMWFGIFADVGVMVISVVNAIRALKVNKN